MNSTGHAREQWKLVAATTAVIATASYADADTFNRPLSTDRPDRTESPYSVPPGLFQVEMDLATYGEFEHDDTKIEALGVGVFNLKYGVTRNLDLQVVFAPYLRTRTAQGAGPDDTDGGTGPAGVRAKINLTGNDSGTTAVALLPYALVPTRGDEKLDNTLYGVVVPVTAPLAGDRALGLMAGVERLGDADTFGIASATVSSPIGGGWGGFVELFATLNGFDDEDAQLVTLDGGVVFAPTGAWQLDAGVYYGLTSETESWRVFAGVSARR